VRRRSAAPRYEAGADVRVRRNPRARRITLRVTDAGVVVTAPPHVSDGELQRVIVNRADWIAESLARQRADRTAPLAIGDRVPYLGDALDLVPGTRRAAHRTPAGLAVPGDGATGAAVVRWYRGAARTHFTDLVADWAPRIGVTPAGIAIRDQRTRWGSASARGTVSFNWRLIMAAPVVAEYVAVHELVHLRHMNHSPAFWNCVEEYLPGYRAPRDWLRRHGSRLHRGPYAVGTAGDGDAVG
jgi:predicted metal-dependent hydrolase